MSILCTELSSSSKVQRTFIIRILHVSQVTVSQKDDTPAPQVTDECSARSPHFPQTVEDNEQYYSQQQIARAKAARDLLHLVGFPSLKDLKKIITMNAIANCLITHDDVDITEEIYGPDVAILKGKMT